MIPFVRVLDAIDVDIAKNCPQPLLPVYYLTNGLRRRNIKAVMQKYEWERITAEKRVD